MTSFAALWTPGAGGAGLLGWVTVLAQAVESDDPGGDASRRLSLAIVGLLVLAGVILVATIVFWRMTRPERATSAAGTMRWIAPAEDDPAATPAGPPQVAVPPAAPPTAPPQAAAPPRPAPAPGDGGAGAPGAPTEVSRRRAGRS